MPLPFTLAGIASTHSGYTGTERDRLLYSHLIIDRRRLTPSLITRSPWLMALIVLRNTAFNAAPGTGRCSGEKHYEEDGWTDPILQLASAWFSPDKLVP